MEELLLVKDESEVVALVVVVVSVPDVVDVDVVVLLVLVAEEVVSVTVLRLGRSVSVDEDVVESPLTWTNNRNVASNM